MIFNIQILRAFAALNVVFFHIIGIAEKYGRPVYFFEVFDGWGKCGVDIFFVLSGFVVMHSYDGSKKSPGQFFLNRVVRVVPVYWVLIFFLFILNFAVPNLFRSFDVNDQKWLASLFFVSGYFGFPYPVINVGWTLEYEMTFYLLLAMSFFLKNVVWRYVFLLSSIAALVFFDALQLMAFEFLLGILCARIFKFDLILRNWMPLFFLGSIFLCVSIFYRPSMDRFYLYGIPAFLIVLGLINSPNLELRALLFLGDASYSIYLIQFFAISFFYKVIQIKSINLNGDLLSIAALSFSVAFGCLFYVFVEKPITKFFKKMSLR